jgi:hypothetical protein
VEEGTAKVVMDGWLWLRRWRVFGWEAEVNMGQFTLLPFEVQSTSQKKEISR